ncbi:Short C-terminal domain-containing protein [Halovenus aranensis]|uniref:Short C-terminal domain-containing protein n=1 Tax=Halovenus aranensis TaxID=890420 RepID=A0A1G8RW02_9EURY|nr:SHOCT domain-containing protein [Halovenus aranensis]SDJ20520.1 Short C-terminal domain-containing protein [Halovenus aranensis]
MPSGTLSARLTPLFAVVTLPLGILAALFVSLPAAAAVFVVGWLLLTPASAILFGPPEPGPEWADDEVNDLVEERMKEAMDEQDSSADPVEELRERYARGEIDEVELERRLDALLEAEDVSQNNTERIERAVENLDTDTETPEDLLTDRE